MELFLVRTHLGKARTLNPDTSRTRWTIVPTSDAFMFRTLTLVVLPFTIVREQTRRDEHALTVACDQGGVAVRLGDYVNHHLGVLLGKANQVLGNELPALLSTVMM
jgi:hypothetical protein